MPRWRLLVSDVDSTLIVGEAIEMLASYVGRRDEVARITTAAMRGELDFASSLRERVAVLAGLDASVLDDVGRGLTLAHDARGVLADLQRRGMRCGIVSGGFSQITQYLVEDLSLDFSAANTLEIGDGRLTGRLTGPIVDRAGKAAALRRFAQDFDIPLAHTVAIGDGANDLDMMTAAGLSIAYNAAGAARQCADHTIDEPSWASLLPLLDAAAPTTV